MEIITERRGQGKYMNKDLIDLLENFEKRKGVKTRLKFANIKNRKTNLAKFKKENETLKRMLKTNAEELNYLSYAFGQWHKESEEDIEHLYGILRKMGCNITKIKENLLEQKRGKYE